MRSSDQGEKLTVTKTVNSVPMLCKHTHIRLINDTEPTLIIDISNYIINIYICIYMYICIIIMSRYEHGYFWPTLANPPYCPLLLAGLPCYIQYQHGAAVFMFVLAVLPLLVPVKGSTGVHYLRARPDFSSSVPHVWFV